MVRVTINNKEIEVAQGLMIIEAAEAAGIYIPRFCYHKKLSIVANCRMCLVECDNSRKPLPACATPVMPGMKIQTRSKMALEAQRAVMEFLLINHPLDCPICDQGGECELQDLALGYGSSVSRFTEGKRAVKDKDMGPLIATDMTRCIHCTRCVRFGEEIAGLREIGATGRGEAMEIGTYIEKTVRSELSGNIIDLCPVGALTSKPYRFTGRPWELDQHAGIAPHDCVGTNIFIHTRAKFDSEAATVMRVVPRPNEAINETWIADRERFSYEGLNSPDRLIYPQMKRDGKWERVDWATALEATAKQLREVCVKYGASHVGALAHPSATTEEHYLLQKLMRGMGVFNIDHRLRSLDTSDQEQTPTYPSLGTTLPDIEKEDVILLIGSNVQQEQPLISHRIRKAALQGTQIIAINPIDYAFNFPLSRKCIVGVEQIVSTLAGIAKALSVNASQPLPAGADKLLENIAIKPAEQTLANHLMTGGERRLLLLGEFVECHSQSGLIRILAHLIALLSSARYGRLTSGANASGAWLAGMLPHRAVGGGVSSEIGFSVVEMFAEKLKAYVLLGIEPEFDFANTQAALTALGQANTVIALSAYRSAALEKVADIMLPIAAFAETPGTFVNIEAVWQSFNAATLPLGEARPAWKILRVLGNLFELDGFNYASSLDVLKEMKTWMPAQMNQQRSWQAPSNDIIRAVTTTATDTSLMRIGYWPLYSADSVVRRATALQKMQPDDIACAHLSPGAAKALNLNEGDTVVFAQSGVDGVRLKLRINPRVAENNVMIATGLADTLPLGIVCGPIRLQQAKKGEG